MDREEMSVCAHLPVSLLYTMPCLCLGLAFQLVGGSLASGALLAWWFGV